MNSYNKPSTPSQLNDRVQQLLHSHNPTLVVTIGQGRSTPLPQEELRRLMWIYRIIPN